MRDGWRYTSWLLILQNYLALLGKLLGFSGAPANSALNHVNQLVVLELGKEERYILRETVSTLSVWYFSEYENCLYWKVIILYNLLFRYTCA